MTPKQLDNEELTDMIEKLEDRIETTKEFLSDADDGNTVFVLRQRLALYNNQLEQCKAERLYRNLQ